MKRKLIAGAVIGLALAHGVAWVLPKAEPAQVQTCEIMAQWC